LTGHTFLNPELAIRALFWEIYDAVRLAGYTLISAAPERNINRIIKLGGV
jgi:hypothetical protein